MAASDDPDLSSGHGVDEAEEEGQLWRDFKRKGSSDARARLFNLHLEFARRIAKGHYLDRKRGDIELADLVQLANAGLLEALDHFDPSRGAPFRAYARRRIVGSILDGLTHMSEMREQQSFRRRVRRDRVRSLLSEDSQGAGSTADALESLIDLATGLAVGFMLEGSGGFADDSAADPGPSAYSTLAWKETVNLLLAELESLPDREQTIIRQHYIVGLNFDQIADGLQVSRGRVSQLHRSGLARLRVRLGATEPFFLTK